MKILNGGLENVPGFKYSAIKCGIKYSDRLDYSAIFSEKPCNASGVFTKNKIFAAPVQLCRERINNPVKAILINATNANACTGTEGYENAVKLTGNIAEKINAEKNSILMCSTGIIGHQLPVSKMLDSHKSLVEHAAPENGKILPEAIMTTDTFPKSLSVSFETTIGEFTIAGTAKGSGMIAPDMATLLSFVVTNAPVSKADLDCFFKSSVNKSFNSITIDGDMSTNDTAIILSPDSNEYLTKQDDLNNFEKALTYVLTELATMLVKDGEGSTKLVKINVKGARSHNDAELAARAISESLLVKTAFFGKDPNWGRIAAAAGYSGAEIHEYCLSISFENIPLLQNGKPVNFDMEKLGKILEQDNFSVTVDLGIGEACATMITSDISYDYIKINAEYST